MWQVKVIHDERQKDKLQKKDLEKDVCNYSDAYVAYLAKYQTNKAN